MFWRFAPLAFLPLPFIPRVAEWLAAFAGLLFQGVGALAFFSLALAWLLDRRDSRWVRPAWFWWVACPAFALWLSVTVEPFGFARALHEAAWR